MLLALGDLSDAVRQIERVPEVPSADLPPQVVAVHDFPAGGKLRAQLAHTVGTQGRNAAPAGNALTIRELS